MRLGEFELDILSDGTFMLDGGAMFGTVPKVLWEKTNPADERNRIRLGLNCLLIRAPGETILIDTGIGSAYDDKFAFRYGVDKSTTDLLRGLAAAGVAAADVTRVVLTHLHFDHCGGCCVQAASGDFEPAFPQATYYVDGGELDRARAPDPRSKASYVPHTFEPLAEAGRLELTSGEADVVPGVTLFPTPGHTENHRSVLVRSGGQTACFLADLVPTPSHLKPHYVMGYDVLPVETMKTRQRVLEQARSEEWLLVFEHSADVPAGYLGADLVSLERHL